MRATHGAHEGSWYFEVKVTHLGATGHCRIGWATRKAELQAPVSLAMNLSLLAPIPSQRGGVRAIEVNQTRLKKVVENEPRRDLLAAGAAAPRASRKGPRGIALIGFWR